MGSSRKFRSNTSLMEVVFAPSRYHGRTMLVDGQEFTWWKPREVDLEDLRQIHYYTTEGSEDHLEVWTPAGEQAHARDWKVHHPASERWYRRTEKKQTLRRAGVGVFMWHPWTPEVATYTTPVKRGECLRFNLKLRKAGFYEPPPGWEPLPDREPMVPHYKTIAAQAPEDTTWEAHLLTDEGQLPAVLLTNDERTLWKAFDANATEKP